MTRVTLVACKDSLQLQSVKMMNSQTSSAEAARLPRSQTPQTPPHPPTPQTPCQTPSRTPFQTPLPTRTPDSDSLSSCDSSSLSDLFSGVPDSSVPPSPDLEANDTDADPWSDTNSNTTSLTSSAFLYEEKYGRFFEQKEGTYMYPIDEEERERLDKLHNAYTLFFNDRLFHAPINPDGDFYAVDIGTGTGIWAMDFADEYPNATVEGWDIALMQPTFVPPNLIFILDNAEKDWMGGDMYDYVHVRDLAGSIKDWPRLIRQIYENLKPGGWAEFHEVENSLFSADGTPIIDGNALAEMQKLRGQAHAQIGRTLDAAPDIPGWASHAGFHHVTKKQFQLPVGMCSEERLGEWFARNFYDGVHAFTAKPLEEVLGWTEEERKIFNVEVHKAVEFAVRGDFRLYQRLSVVTAQKPGI